MSRSFASGSLASGCSIRSINRDLGRPASSISREITKNGGLSKYRASLAEKAILKKARCPKAFLLAKNHALRDLVAEKLALNWSPEQISGWLKNEGDLIIGANGSAIATLVERHSRFTVLCKVQNKSTLIVVQSFHGSI